MQPEIKVNQEILRIIFKQYADQLLSPDEESTLADWLADSPWNRRTLEQIMDEEWMSDNMAAWNQVTSEHLWPKVQQKMGEPTPVVPITAKRSRKWMYAAAAVVLIIGSTSALLLWNRWPPAGQRVSQVASSDVAPGTNTAMLTLADGSTILLDSVAEGQLARQGDAMVIKAAGGQLRYEGATSPDRAAETTLNTLSTPKGGQYQLSLPDGTKVRLNAASSITYPTSFSKTARQVKVTGEAYFQVAKDASRPFRVSAAATEVEVLGTHFNISAYENEPAVATTLEEGSVNVRVTATGQSQRLSPGQQALVPRGQKKISLVEQADMEETFAWIHGTIAFHDADVATIMRALERWYNITVDIKGSLQDRSFYFSVNRNAPLSEVLHFLEVYKIRYSLDAANRRLTITP